MQVTQDKAATNKSDEQFLGFLSLSEIIELYLFYPEQTSMEINNATVRQFGISGARSLLFDKLIEDQLIK